MIIIADECVVASAGGRELHSGLAESATRWVPARPEPAGRDDAEYFNQQ